MEKEDPRLMNEPTTNQFMHIARNSKQHIFD